MRLNPASDPLFPELSAVLEEAPRSIFAVPASEERGLLPANLRDEMSVTFAALAIARLTGLVLTAFPATTAAGVWITMAVNNPAVLALTTGVGTSLTVDTIQRIGRGVIRPDQEVRFADIADVLATGLVLGASARALARAPRTPANFFKTALECRRIMRDTKAVLSSGRLGSRAAVNVVILQQLESLLFDLRSLTPLLTNVPAELRAIRNTTRVINLVGKLVNVSKNYLTRNDVIAAEYLASDVMSKLTAALCSVTKADATRQWTANELNLAMGDPGIKLPQQTLDELLSHAHGERILAALHADASKFKVMTAEGDFVPLTDPAATADEESGAWLRPRLAWQLIQAYEECLADIDEVKAQDTADADLMSNKLPFEGDIAESLRQIYSAFIDTPRATPIGKVASSVVSLPTTTPYASYVEGLTLRLAVLDRLGLLTGFHIRLMSGPGSVDALAVAHAMQSATGFVNCLVPPSNGALSTALPLLITGSASPTTADVFKLRSDLSERAFPQGDVVEAGKIPTVYNSIAPLTSLPSLSNLLFDASGAFDDFLIEWTLAYGVMGAAWSPFRVEIEADTKKYTDAQRALATTSSFKAHFADLVPAGPGDPKPTPGYDPSFIHDRQYVCTRAEAVQGLIDVLYTTVPTVDLGIAGLTDPTVLADMLTIATRKLRQTGTLSLTVPVSHARLIRSSCEDRRVKVEGQRKSITTETRVLPPARQRSARITVQPGDFTDVPLSTILLTQAIMAYGYKTYTTTPRGSGVPVVGTPVAASRAATFAPALQVTRPSVRMALPGIETLSGTDVYTTAYFDFPIILMREAAVAADLDALSIAHSPDAMTEIRTKARKM